VAIAAWESGVKLGNQVHAAHNDGDSVSTSTEALNAGSPQTNPAEATLTEEGETPEDAVQGKTAAAASDEAAAEDALHVADVPSASDSDGGPLTESGTSGTTPWWAGNRSHRGRGGASGAASKVGSNRGAAQEASGDATGTPAAVV